MAGYTRVDTINNIADGNVINAADLDGEFDGIQAAFNSSTGHNHDGTAGEGAPILALGPAQDVTISTSVLGVKTTNTVDLGTNSLKFKDFYLAGNASVGGTLGVTGATTLSAALTYGGVTLNNAVTGTGNMVLSASPTLTGTLGAAAATFSGAVALNGNTTIGDADTDTITQAASYVTGTQLKSAKTATNTLSLAAYDVDGTAYTNLITLTASNTPTLALTSTGVGTINNMSIGATTASTGAFTTLSATGNTTIGDASTDTVTVNGTTTFNASPIISVTDNTNAALRITQLGTGNALLVEDSTNPDSTPFAITATGAVLVATTTAKTTGVGSAVMQIFGGTAPLSFYREADSTTPINLEFAKARAAGAILASGDTIGRLYFSGSDGTAQIPAAYIDAAVDGTPGTNDMPGRLVFSTTADGASTPTERMRIDNRGAVGFGSTALTTTAFRLGTTITGATTAYGAFWGSTVQPTVTASGVYNATSASTASNGGTPWTLTGLRHYQAAQGTFNADSTVTNQFGFTAESSLTGATNNYGFYGNLASASNVWNLYMAGTAANYFAGQAQFANGSVGTPSISNINDTNTGIFFPAADTIAFSEGGVESMRIDSSGNVGIGTSSPAAALHVTGTSRTQRIGSSYAYEWYVSSTNRYFLTNVTAATEPLSIDSSGNLLVGTTTSLGSCLTTKNSSGSTPVHAVQHYSSAAAVWYMLRFFNGAGSGGGAITLNTSTLATAYTTSSDYRLKHDIAPMTGALERVAALKPVTYKWNVDDSDGEGFIAHELQEVVPDAVTGEKDAVDAEGNPQYQGVDTSFLVATLTAAIQELKALVDGQAVLIATQASTITALQADVEALKAQGTP